MSPAHATVSLFRKELRGALPLACLWCCLWSTGIAEYGLVHAPDLTTFAHALDGFRQPWHGCVFGAIASLWLAGMLIPTEHSEGTIEFLDALPTTRSRVFAVKAATGCLVLWSGPFLQLLIALGFDRLSRTSVETGSRLAMAGPWLLLCCLQLTVLFSFALVLCFLRRFVWLASALVLMTYLLLCKFVPAAHVLDIGALAEPVPFGHTLAIPWRHIAVQVPLALLCLLFAWRLFCGLGDRIVAFGERLTSTALGRAAVAAVAVLSVALWIIVPAVLVSNSEDEPEKDEHGVVYVSWAHSRATTGHYSFTYPSSASDRAGAVLARADQIHDSVQSFFGAEPLPRVEVDATGAGPRHFAGRAFHETVQIELAGAPSDDDAVAVLAHETTHVFIDTIGNNAFEKIFDWTRCLHEGLASYVEHRFFRTAADLAASRRLAALAHAWKRLDLETLVDDETLCAKRDGLLVYPAGELLLASLVDVHGDAAPGALVRSFGRADRPQGLKSIDLWRDAFQAAGFDMEAVANRFAARLDEEAARCADLVATLPRPSGRVTEQRGDGWVDWVGITPDLDRELPPGWSVRVDFRRADDDDAMDDSLEGEEREGTWWVRRKDVPGRRLSYRFTLSSKELEAAVRTDWQETALSR